VPVPTDLAHARDLDARDELAPFRDRFVIDEPELIYLDGNSLGRLPRETAARTQDLVRDQWGRRLIRGWNDGWLSLAVRVGAKIARVIGAATDEVLVADSTSVNLFKLVVAAVQARPGRTRLVTDDLNFPTDVYVMQAAARLAGPGYGVDVVRSPDGIGVPLDTLAGAVDERTAVVVLSHTAFKSGFVYDLAAVTELAHRRGALVLWDLSHSAGAVPVDLSAAEADLAVGCTYKYLHGGPGAPAFLYVRRDLQANLSNPIAGWFGCADQFGFGEEYVPAGDLRRFLSGTPPVLSLAAVEPGVDLILEAGMERIRRKSVGQTEYLIALWEAVLTPLGFRLRSPRDSGSRGSHVALGHPEGWRIARALTERMKVIPDFRPPDTLRLGVSPLCTTFAEIHAAVQALRMVVEERLFERYSAERSGVT
jgi:kynureninase